MGIVHKLKPEVLNFILEHKQKDPTLSCRNLTQLILEKLQVKVSKSSINTIFKEHNLSMPIGRRQKHRKKKFNMPVLPVIEGTKAVTVIAPPEPESTINPITASPPDVGEVVPKSEIASSPEAPRNDTESTAKEEKRIKEAEEWAMRLREEEQARIKEKLELEKQKQEEGIVNKKTEETEVKALLEEAARVKAKEEQRQRELEKAAQEVVEKKRLEEEAAKAKEQAKRAEEERAAQETKLKAEEERLAKLAEEEAKSATEKKKLDEEARKAEEERLAQEAALKAEREKWARLAEEEHKAKQQKAEEVILPKEEPVRASALPQDSGYPGAVLLKALDCLIGGSKEINEAICREMGVLSESSLSLTEAVIFRPLFGKDNLELLWKLIGRQYSSEELDNYYAQINQLKNLKSNISNIFSNFFTEARGLKLHFIDGNAINLDGQLHSAWGNQNIPFDFAASVCELKNNLTRDFLKTGNLILFSAPGYDVVPKDFFNLLLNFCSTDKYPDILTLFGNKLEELEVVSLNKQNNVSLIFGLWPWQFTSTRKVKRIGEFNLKRIEGIDQDMYLADIEIDLLLASTNQSVSLKGCAVKTIPTEKIRLVVLNSSKETVSSDELAEIYLDRWPNLEEAFHDFSRKTERFSYVSNGQKFFSKDSCGIEIANEASNLELDKIFVNYIKILDAYLRWHFFPSGYIENDFSFTSKHFYKLPVKLVTGKNQLIAQMQAEQGQFTKDLEYLVRRLNERQINLENGLRLYFGNAFK